MRAPDDDSSRPRLLLVDDNEDNLEVLTMLLGRRYRVASCSSAAQAVALVAEFRPEVLVLDIRMAPVDGRQCLRAIRAVPGFASVPAIALTALAHDAERQACLSAGFQVVVTKPVLDAARLIAVIDNLLGVRGGRPGLARRERETGGTASASSAVAS